MMLISRYFQRTAKNLVLACALLVAAGCTENATPSPLPPTPTPEVAAAVPTNTPASALPTATSEATETPARLFTPTGQPVGTPAPRAGGWRQVGAAGKRVQDLAIAMQGGSPALA